MTIPFERAIRAFDPADATHVRADETELVEGDRHDLEVDTVDSFQGSERDAIVISFARSNDAGEIGFLGRPEDGPRRLNVALTRARRFCALVGDWATLREPREGKRADLYESLYEHMREHARIERVERADSSA